MNKNNFYAWMITALVAVSCTKNEVSNYTGDQTLTIVADIASQSRVPKLGEDGSGTLQKVM